MSTLPPLPLDERVLLLLGLLTSQDRHGYEINDFIERQLNCVTDLKKATAYQLLDRLEQHDLIRSRLEQHGHRPNRKVYTLTEAGHAQFLALLSEHLRKEEPLMLAGNIPLMFFEHLPPEQRQAALQERIAGLEERLEILDKMVNFPSLTLGVQLAIRRIAALTRADLDWLRELVAGDLG